MTSEEAIYSLIQSCKEYEECIRMLKSENAFLNETIKKNGLVDIANERRVLLIKNEQIKRDAAKQIKQARKLEHEYKDAYNDIKDKQEDINSFIDGEAERKAASIKEKYKRQKTVESKKTKKIIEKNQEECAKYKAECDDTVREITEKIRLEKQKMIIITAIGIAVGIIGILINIIQG